MILRQKLVWREKQLAVVTRAVVLAGLLVQSFAFGSTAWAPATPRIRQACSSNRPNAMAPIPLRMQLQGPGEGSDELPAGWGKVAINLEGHFKPSVGFVPHALKTDGDFASGDAKFDLKYDHAAGGAKTAVEICGVGPTYEDFIAGFTPQSDPGWSVDPAEGCLDVQGGEADCLQVTYSGACDAPKFGTLVVVIPSISESFTFKFRVQP